MKLEVWESDIITCTCTNNMVDNRPERIKWAMIIAVMNAIWAIAYRSLKKSGLQRDLNPWPRDTGANEYFMKPLTLGAGHLWVLMSPWRMDVKWYMKCFIYWTADLKSSELWSSQLWTHFEQLRIEAWKSQDFNGVWTRDIWNISYVTSQTWKTNYM